MDPEANDYLRDAIYFLRRTAKLLNSQMNREIVLDSVLNFAFGMERLCLAILHDINPVFTLEPIAFGDIVRLSHSDSLVGEPPGYGGAVKMGKNRGGNQKSEKKALWSESEPIRTLGFRSAMERLIYFHAAAGDNSERIHRLADYRNIIAHRMLSELADAEAFLFCQRWFHPFISEFASESGFDPNLCFGSEAGDVQTLSERAKSKMDFQEKLDQLKDYHRKIWEKLSRNPTAASQKHSEAHGEFAMPGPFIPFTCPACGQKAKIIYGFDFEPALGDGALVRGATHAEELDCTYCGFHLKSDTNPEAFDVLGIGKHLRSVIPEVRGYATHKGVFMQSTPRSVGPLL